MPTAEPSRNAVAPPTISCEPLPVFDRTDLESVRTAFRSAASCSLWQAWRGREETGFSPGTVRIGSRQGSLLVFAELTDKDISNNATQLNQRVWELGDVFEIFLRHPRNESYVEFHVTPNNQRLQLCYPNAAAVESVRLTGSFEKFLVPGDAFYSKTWIKSTLNKWFVYAEIPTAIVCGSDEYSDNKQWRFSFGRYDYTRGVKEPVISSTSPHLEPDFHRHHEWGVMTIDE
jgi:hypothetical protein